MASDVILDTNVIIDYLKRSPDPDARKVFHAITTEKLQAHMTSITVFELDRGAGLSPEPERALEAVKVLRGYMNVLPFSGETAETAAELRVLGKEG